MGVEEEEENGRAFSLPPLDADIPFDPRCRTGKVGSGIAFYCRTNTKPQNRSELWVCLKVGSALESDSERGIAHLIEHLAFRGSRGSSPTETFALVEYLEHYGCQFGAHQNAYTSLEETVFTLHIPSSSHGAENGGGGGEGDGSLDLVLKGLVVLRALSLEIRLSDEDVEAERPIVEEEWRASRGAAQRAGEAYFALLTEGSLYAERLPIGKMEVIRNISPEEVRAFYRSQYHPHRMAVVAVGDFGGEEGLDRVVGFIHDVFGSIVPECPIPPQHKLIEIPSHDEPRVQIFPDREMTSTSIVVELRLPKQDMIKVRDFRDAIVEDLFHHMLGMRLRKLSLVADPPFLSAATETTNPVGELFTVRLTIATKANQVMRALSAAMFEVERVKVFGFTDIEMEKAKKDMSTRTTRMWLEREQADSASFCDEYKAHFLQQTASPGIEWQAQVEPLMLETIGVEEVSKLAELQFKWWGDTMVHIALSQPSRFLMNLASGRRAVQRWFLGYSDNEESEEDRVLTPEIVLERLKTPPSVPSDLLSKSSRQERAANSSEPLVVEFKDLISPRLEPGSIVRKIVHESTGACELTLSNGMEVTYLPTRDFQDDEVLYRAFAHGGLSELAESEYPSGKLATVIAEELGIFGVEPGCVADLLSGCIVGLSPEIDVFSHGFHGECSSRDLESQLQVIHRFLECDQEKMFCETRVRYIMSCMNEALRNAARDPGVAYEAEIERVNSCGHPFLAPSSTELMRRVNPKRAVTYFRRLFCDPSQFRLVVCGNIPSPEKFEELCELYLASIPVPPPNQSCNRISRTGVRRLHVSFPPKLVTRTVRMPMLDKDAGANCTLSFPVSLGGGRAPSHEERLRESQLFHLINQIVERRLIEVLRFERGAIYNISVGATFATSAPLELPCDSLEGVTLITLTCSTREVGELRRKIVQEMDKLAHEGPTDQEVHNCIAADKQEHETMQKTNSYWLNTLAMQYSSPRYDPPSKGAMDAFLETEAMRLEIYELLDRDEFIRAFRAIYGTQFGRRTEVTLVPLSWTRRITRWTLFTVATLAAAALVTSVTKKRR